MTTTTCTCTVHERPEYSELDAECPVHGPISTTIDLAPMLQTRGECDEMSARLRSDVPPNEEEVAELEARCSAAATAFRATMHRHLGDIENSRGRRAFIGLDTALVELGEALTGFDRTGALADEVFGG